MSYDSPILVAIRCITYNHAPYIRQCLEGFVMQQTNFRYVAIVHDDASTDGTAEIIREYEEKYPEIIKPIYEIENQYSKRDGSLKRIMADAIDATHCKYIAICEGDDYWTDPQKLQKQIDILEENKDCVLVYTDAHIVDKDSNRIFSNKPNRPSGNITEKLILEGNPIVTATTCYKYEYMAEYENNAPPFPLLMGDYPLWIYMSTKGNFYYLPAKTTSYRLLENSASHNSSFEVIKKFQKNSMDIRLYYNSLLSMEISESIIEKSYYHTIIRISSKYAKADFMHVFKEGIKKYPSLILNPKIFMICVLRIMGIKI